MVVGGGGLTMSAQTTVTEFLGDAVHSFRLPLGQLEELQEKTKAGPQALLERLIGGTWTIRDVTETIRLGLIGGGMLPADAHQFIGRYVDQQPLSTSLGAAVVILSATLNGRQVEDAGGNAAAAKSKSEPAPTGLTLPPSDEAPPSSASRRPNSKPSRSRKSKTR